MLSYTIVDSYVVVYYGTLVAQWVYRVRFHLGATTYQGSPSPLVGSNTLECLVEGGPG